MRYVYGPVPSWRLGCSLGIDPLGGSVKRCTFDCRYCQLGPTPPDPVRPEAWVSPADLEEELRTTRGLVIDTVTFAGMGEPTLAFNLEALLRVPRRVIGAPVAVLTNGSLLLQPAVRATLGLAERVVVKLDAATEEASRPSTGRVSPARSPRLSKAFACSAPSIAAGLPCK